MANEYAKVILYVYPYLSELSDAVGVAAVNKAMLSFRSRDDALRTAERIVDELAVKSKLVRLEKAVDAVLQAFDEEEMYLLEYKYFRRRRVLREKYADYCLQCSERTYFRKQSAVFKKFASRLALYGWTEQAYQDAFENFSPFLRVFEVLKSGREVAIMKKRTRCERVVGSCGR